MSETLSRRLLFVGVCVCSTVIGAAYIIRYSRSMSATSKAPDVRLADNMAVLGNRPGILFSSAAFDATNGYLEILAIGDHHGPRYRTSLRCERVHFASGIGICVAVDRGVLTTVSARIFGDDFQVRQTLPIQGFPSRARVSPDGRRGAVTVFVSGDSYSSTSFSTRTTLIDMTTGHVIADLEEFAVWRDQVRIQSVDFNFWGVTFAPDGNRFFATLRTMGTNYLVEGDTDARSLKVLRDGVECPSLSPDAVHIAFKKRVGAATWHLRVLEVKTMAERALAETRSVDDQPEWLDDQSIVYALPANEGGTGASNVWTVTLDGKTPPIMLVDQAYSPAAVR